jgi:hypothetical protein
MGCLCSTPEVLEQYAAFDTLDDTVGAGSSNALPKPSASQLALQELNNIKREVEFATLLASRTKFDAVLAEQRPSHDADADLPYSDASDSARREASARAAAYEAAEVRWSANDENIARTRAIERGVPPAALFHFHASHGHAFDDFASIEAARLAAVEHGLAAAAPFECADASGSDGMVDWRKTDEVPELARDDNVLRRMSLRPASAGPRTSLRHVGSVGSTVRGTYIDKEAATKLSAMERGIAAARRKVASEKEEEGGGGLPSQKKRKQKTPRSARRLSSLRLPAFAVYGGGSQNDSQASTISDVNT